MLYRNFGNTNIQVSAIALGGHEFAEGGRIRGFQDDHKLAVQRGYVFDGFGQAHRREILKQALDLGINLFDVTIDSEKEAMGRLLRDLGSAAGDDIMVQTRPEGMVYTYDPDNRQMAQYDLLRAEVERICGLLGRDHVDVLNLAFMKSALDADPDYLAKIGENVRRLKQAGLIRFAGADTFSGEATYLRQYATGHFDATFINYSPMEQAMEDEVIPAAYARGLAVLTRECFSKGRWFTMAEEAGIRDRALAARCALKWCLRDPRISSTVLGVADAGQLESNCRALASPDLSDDEQGVLDAICATACFREEHERRRQGLKQ